MWIKGGGGGRESERDDEGERGRGEEHCSYYIHTMILYRSRPKLLVKMRVWKGERGVEEKRIDER